MSGDLRAAVERLPVHRRRNGFTSPTPWVNLQDVLRLIPEGAVLVTEETLAELQSILTVMLERQTLTGSARAAAILRQLREGT